MLHPFPKAALVNASSLGQFIVEKNTIENEVKRLSFLQLPRLSEIEDLRRRVRNNFLPFVEQLRDSNAKDLSNFKIGDFLARVYQELLGQLDSLDDPYIMGNNILRERTFYKLHDFLIGVNREAHQLERFPNHPYSDNQ